MLRRFDPRVSNFGGISSASLMIPTSPVQSSRGPQEWAARSSIAQTPRRVAPDWSVMLSHLPQCNLIRNSGRRFYLDCRISILPAAVRSTKSPALDIASERAMLGTHQIASCLECLCLVVDVRRVTLCLVVSPRSPGRSGNLQAVTFPGSRKSLSGGTLNEDTRRSRVPGQEAA
jgi:hypothetical protein